jgi:hypothetical protein
MTSRFILPFADVGSGIKLSSGAKLFFFQTDGVTPKDTFSDQLSTPTPNTNPVIANAVGVFGDIYIDGDYKVDLKDENGSQIFAGAEVSEFATGNFDTNLINDLSQAYEFDTQQLMIDSLIAFPVGKKIVTTQHTSGSGVGGATYIKRTGATALPFGSPDLDSGGHAEIQDGDTFDLCSYGVLGISGTTDTNGFLEVITKLAAKGGGSLIQNSDLLIEAIDGQVMAALDGLESFSHVTNGHKVKDIKTDWLNGEGFTLYNLKNIGTTYIDMVAESQPSIVKTEPIDADKVPKLGMVTFTIEGGCKSGTINLKQVGGQRAVGFDVPNISPIPKDEFSGNFTVNLDTFTVHYAFRATGNGKNITVNLNCEETGRPWYIYGGATNITVNATTKNSFKTGLVAAFLGQGATNITINAEDKNTDEFINSTNYAALRFGDITPATFRNIEFNFDIETKAGAGWTWGFELGKFASAVADPTGRGHNVAGLKIHGSIKGSATGTLPIKTTGVFVEGSEIITGVDISDLICNGGTSNLNLFALVGGANIRNVLAADGADAFNVPTNANSRITFTGCKTLLLNKTGVNTYNQTYIDCEITAAILADIEANKTFINTEVSGAMVDSYQLSFGGQREIVKQISGDLSTPINLAQVKKNQILIEIEYYLVQDRLAGTRVEAYGVISLTATVASDGSWGLYQSQVQYIPEQLSTAPTPALTIGLTTGDATDGGFINISSAAYNNANGRAVFRVKIKSLDGALTVKEV